MRHARQFQIRLWNGGTPLTGTLRELAADADPATRTYPARIAIDGDSSRLQLGMTASAALPDAAAAQLRSPLTALLDEQGRHYVWLIGAAGKVTRRAVTVSRIDAESATLSQGVQPGDKIVTAGIHLLRDGQSVKLLER